MLRPSSLPHARAPVTARVRPLHGLRVVAALAVASVTAALLLAGLLVPAAPARAEAPTDPTQPLVLHIRSITPDYVPDHGPIVIRGTVRNASNEQWTGVNVHGFMGSVPMTTSAELAAAVQTPVATDVGARITLPGTFDHIDSLQPGQVTTFEVRLPRSVLPVSAPGVYWFGVHVLGGSSAGFSGNAVGRDRTFIPYIPSSLQADGQLETAALVLPLRAEVTRGSDGTLLDAAGWQRSLASGALHDVLAVGRAARGTPLSWVVDPAVTDAVRQLAAGNPPRTLVTPGTPTGPSASQSPTASPSVSGAAAANDTTPARQRRTAQQWLTEARGVLMGAGEVLGLPYGDMAVGSALRWDPALLDEGFRRTGTTLKPWGVPLSSLVAPPTDRIRAGTVADLPRATEVLLDDTAVTGTAPTASAVGGRRLLLSSSGAAQGGPGPVDPTSPLALRQRILAEAAVRYLSGRQPLVVQLPASLHPAGAGQLFSGLDAPWLRMTTLDDATAGPVAPLTGAQLRPPAIGSPRLGPHFYATARRALDEATTLQSVLPGNTLLRRQIFQETAADASYSSSQDPVGALARVRSTAAWVSGNLAGIELSAPDSVTLASANGRFSAVVSNTLDVPVTVKVRAVSDPRLVVSGGETVNLAPHGRTTVLLKATARRLGVHTVTLELTNEAGQPLGAQDQFPVRAEQVSQLIWVIIGAGIGLLFAAIVVRLVRRVMRARAARRTGAGSAA